MNGSTLKKRARELQAITGMPYQSAHRAVVDGTEFQASIRSRLSLGDFITPREMRIWHLVNGTGAFDCANGRHWMPEEVLGQCVGCGVYMAEEYDSDGGTYETTIDEARFFEKCIATEMYCNWAPPMSHIEGLTQAEYFRRNWRPSDEDLVDLFDRTLAGGTDRESAGTATGNINPWQVQTSADAEAMTLEQIDLMRAVDELQTEDTHPSTKDVGARMLDLMKERGGPYFWSAAPPWHGTNPAADQLRNAGLVEVHVGMANFRRWDQPAESPQQYWLELTDAGRRALAAMDADDVINGGRETVRYNSATSGTMTSA